jgi:hypothetical protein
MQQASGSTLGLAMTGFFPMVFHPLSWLGLAQGFSSTFPCAGPLDSKVGEPLADPPTSVALSAAPDCTQCDENQKNGYNITHGRICPMQRLDPKVRSMQNIVLHFSYLPHFDVVMWILIFEQ